MTRYSIYAPESGNFSPELPFADLCSRLMSSGVFLDAGTEKE